MHKGEHFAQLRKDRGLTQQDVADDAGRSVQTVRGLEGRADYSTSAKTLLQLLSVPPHANKTDHAGRERRVMLGPRALEVLRPFLQAKADSSPVFSAREAAQHVEMERRSMARVYVSPANRPDARKARRAAQRGGPRGRAPHARYTVCAYGRALRRACERAGLPKDQWFSPHQLRHLRATQVANLMDVHVAQKVLGHASITTTMLYVHTHDEAAVRAAREHG